MNIESIIPAKVVKQVNKTYKKNAISVEEDSRNVPSNINEVNSLVR